MNSKNTLMIGAIVGALCVAIGAFGAHALKPMLAQTGRLETYELAVRYAMYHALAMLIAGVIQPYKNNVLTRLSGLFFLVGVALFSGSLLILCFTEFKPIAIATPFGGVAFIAGWALLAIGVSRD